MEFEQSHLVEAVTAHGARPRAHSHAAGRGGKGAEKTPALENEWPLYRSASSVHIHTYIESHQEFPASTLGATNSAVHGTRVFRFQTKVCLPHLWHLACANRKQTDSFPRAVPSCTERLAEWNRDSTGISILQSPTQRLNLRTQRVEQTRVLAGLGHGQISCP